MVFLNSLQFLFKAGIFSRQVALQGRTLTPVGGQCLLPRRNRLEWPSKIPAGHSLRSSAL
ncbi:hypothetical protein HO920_08080 [Streptococcus suis]|nr:hypothetical protein [Streptococcus suis]